MENPFSVLLLSLLRCFDICFKFLFGHVYCWPFSKQYIHKDFFFRNRFDNKRITVKNLSAIHVVAWFTADNSRQGFVSNSRAWDWKLRVLKNIFFHPSNPKKSKKKKKKNLKFCDNPFLQTCRHKIIVYFPPELPQLISGNGCTASEFSPILDPLVRTWKTLSLSGEALIYHPVICLPRMHIQSAVGSTACLHVDSSHLHPVRRV